MVALNPMGKSLLKHSSEGSLSQHMKLKHGGNMSGSCSLKGVVGQ